MARRTGAEMDSRKSTSTGREGRMLQKDNKKNIHFDEIKMIYFGLIGFYVCLLFIEEQQTKVQTKVNCSNQSWENVSQMFPNLNLSTCLD